MKASSFKTTFYDYLRIFFQRINYIALCMVLSVGGAVIYAFVLADEVYLATNDIYVTQVRDTALLSGLTKVSSLRDRLTLMTQLIKSEPSVKSLIAKFWTVAKEFPGQADIQEEALAHLEAGLAENPNSSWVAQAVKDAEENLRRIGARDRRSEELAAVLEKDPRNWEAASEVKSIQKQARQELSKLQNTIQSFTRDIDIRLRHSKIDVSYQSTDPELARAVTDEIVRQIIDRYLELQTREISFAEKVYEDQVARYIKATKAARAALEGYAQMYPEEYTIPIRLSSDPESNLQALDMLPMQKNETLRTYQAIQQGLAEVDAATKETTQRIERLKNQLQDTAGTVISEVVAETPLEAKKARDQIGQLQLQLSELLVDGTEDHPLVKQTRKKIHLIEAYLNKIAPSVTVSQTTVPNPVREQILKQLQQEEAELPALIARQKDFTERSLLYEQKIRGIPKRVLDLEELRVDYEQKKKTLEMYRARLEDARINRQLELEEKVTTLHVQGSARLHYKPIRPDKRLSIILGVLVGLFASGATVFFLEYADHSIKGIEDARRYLNAPILGTIPEFKSSERWWSVGHRSSQWLIWLGIVLAAVIVAAAAISPKARDFVTRLTQTRLPSTPELAAPRPTEPEVSPSPQIPTVKPSDDVIAPQPQAVTPTPEEAADSPPPRIPTVRPSNYIIVEETAGGAE